MMQIDTAQAKELLRSTDMDLLNTTATALAEHTSSSDIQRLKLQILLWTRLLQLQRHFSTSRNKQARSLYMCGLVWLRMGDYGRAKGQFTRSLELNPSQPGAWQGIGDSHLGNNEFPEALEALERSAFLYQEAEATPNEEGDTGSASSSSSSVGLDRALVYSKLSSVHMTLANYEQSLQMAMRAVEVIESESPTGDDEDSLPASAATVFRQLGEIREVRGEYEEAVSALDKAHKVLERTIGKTHPQTQEVSYLLILAQDMI